MEQLMHATHLRSPSMCLNVTRFEKNVEILSDGAGFALLHEDVPTKKELHISKEQELSFNRLLKFLAMHEPTGYEKDEAHKRAVVQYLALRSMLDECKSTK
uniref:Uncharacterized protein n=1 Tax=Globisporangium ultimum (strain ATCC 200006 / CBS 805.95 / DAOM BR144) TaxID=431595 RepID=K3WZ80_GLOUD